MDVKIITAKIRYLGFENTNFNTLYKSQFLWGYYGSFILGKDSIITNPQIISNWTGSYKTT